MNYQPYRYLTSAEQAEIWHNGFVKDDEYSRGLLLTNHAYYILSLLRKCHQDRYDVLHDVFLYLSDKLYDFDPSKGNIIYYIRRATLNVLSQRSFNNRMQFITLTPTIRVTTRATPQTIMNNKEYRKLRHEVIDKAINTLGIRDRWIVRQRFWKGKSFTDIAGEDGTSPQNIRERVLRILRKLQPVIQERADDLR